MLSNWFVNFGTPRNHVTLSGVSHLTMQRTDSCPVVAKGGTGACPSVVAGIFFSKYNRTLSSTQFVTIYGFVQSNIQYVSSASGG